MLQQIENSCHDVMVAFCVLYTVASLLSWLLTQHRQRPAFNWLSPAIKPVDYKNEDLLLRKELTAVNWQLIANKARALHYLKKAPPALAAAPALAARKLGSRSFSVPQRCYK
jgi:hypothetical protein